MTGLPREDIVISDSELQILHLILEKRRKLFLGLFFITSLFPAISISQDVAPQSSQSNGDINLESFLEETDNVFNEPEIEEEEEVIDFNDVLPPPDDALPASQTTNVRIRTEGFDYAVDGTSTIERSDFGGSGRVGRKSPEELAAEIRREAYESALTGLFPLRPEDIRALLGKYDETRRAVEDPVGGVPTPRVNVETVSLDPGATPLALQTAIGHITTLNILDATGAPWPVQDISWAGDFEVTEPEEGGHIIRISPLSNSAYGNMSIRLLTLKTPVTFMLKAGGDEVQYRVDARIPEYGPFAQAPLIDGGNGLVAGNALIMSVLDGTPPEIAEKLDVSGVDGRTTAYTLNNKIYVRTPLTLLSPGWEQSVSSADGMKVYALNDTPVVLFSDKGKFLRASLSPARDLFDE